MKFLRFGIFLLFPLLAGVGLLLELAHLPSLVGFEHFAFLYPGRFEEDQILSDRGDLCEFKITLIDFSEDEDHPLNIGTYEIDKETVEIMGPEGNRPIEWAQFLDQTRLKDDRLIVITSSLSWNDADELPLLALQEQISSTSNLVIGLRGELLNSEAPFVEYLRNSAIPDDSFSSLDLPEIDHISFQPSIKAPIFGISEVRGLKIEKNGEIHRVPMLVRWGDQILPTLPLACLLTTHGIPPSGLKLGPSGHLRFGKTGIILKLDAQGFTRLRSTAASPQSASKLQVYPEQSETYKVIVLPGAPPVATRLSAQLQQALSQRPKELITYQRFHLTIEIAFLVVMALFLQTRQFWIYLPVFAALLGGSLLSGYWLLLTPFLALILVHLFIRKLTGQPKASLK